MPPPASADGILTRTATGLRLRVRVQPRSSRNRVVSVHGNALKVQVNAAPVEGAANQAVIETLAEWLEVSRRQVVIARGQTGRDKLVDVTSDSPEDFAVAVQRRINRLGSPTLVDKPEARD